MPSFSTLQVVLVSLISHQVKKHPQFPLNHAFASLMNSMIGSEESVDRSLFMNVFMPLFRPQGKENRNQQEDMYYDCA